MQEIVRRSEGAKLLQKLHGLSALLYLYQTKPDKYQQKIEQTQQALVSIVDALFGMKMENEIPHHIGPMLLSSLLVALPKDSALADYVRKIIELEGETKILGVEELVKTFDNVFVLLGKTASGKGTVSQIMHEEYGIQGMATSDWLRGVVQTRDLEEPFNPVMLRDIGDELREEFGGDVLVGLTLQELNKKGSRDVVLDGLRTEKELLNLLGATILWVEAPDELRFDRVKGRGRPGDPQTLPELIEADDRSFPESNKLRELSKTHVTNTSNDMDDLRHQVGQVMVQANIRPVTAIIVGAISQTPP